MSGLKSKPTRVREHLEFDNLESLFWNPATGQLVPAAPTGSPNTTESGPPAVVSCYLTPGSHADGGNPDMLPVTALSQNGWGA